MVFFEEVYSWKRVGRYRLLVEMGCVITVNRLGVRAFRKHGGL